jgi:phosphoserine phosphatase
MLSKIPAQVNGFSQALIDQIIDSVKRAKKETSGPYFAAFDADGTLWSWDVGETFFEFQIERGQLEGLPKDPWEHYQNLKKTNPPWDCMWLAQINKGVEYSRLQKWVLECFEGLPKFEYFQFQKDLIAQLRALDVKIYVVTASVRWAVLPLVKEIYGVNEKNVLGIETQIRNGIITDDAVEPIVWGPGKAEALLRTTGGKRPVFSCGNSMLDLALLESASHASLAINSHPPGTPGFATENNLALEALKRGWLTHKTY